MDVDLRAPARVKPTQPVHCPACGRFSTFVGAERVYRGYASEYLTTVRCKVHGERDVY